MFRFADRAIAIVLLVVHAGLLVWALVGFIEMVWANPPWPRVSNPLFSNTMLFLQWFLVTGAALTFLVGYSGRWPRLPAAMVAWYVAMGTVCAWQTFFILQHPSRFALMALEYAEYLTIALYLHLSPHIRARLIQPFHA